LIKEGKITMKENTFAVLIVTDPITADIYKSLLESSDIPVFLRSDITRILHPVTVGGLSDVEVLVSEDNLAEAVTLINGVEIIIDDESDAVDDAEDFEPEEEI
jgi:hypothetical protein